MQPGQTDLGTSASSMAGIFDQLGRRVLAALQDTTKVAQSALEGIPAGESPYREPKSRCFRFRLVAVVHLRGNNGCCYRKQSLP